jgi:hypothetical protein
MEVRHVLPLLAWALLLAAAPATVHAAPTAPPPPVVVLLLDEFTGPSLQTPGGRVDARRFPHLASLARTATWYRNATTTSDTTKYAVPAALSGQWVGHAEDADRTVFSLLRDTHRLVRYEPWLEPDICPFCARAPRGARTLAGVPIRGSDWPGPSVRGVLGAMRALDRRGGRPPLWFGHVLVPHAPYRFLPDGRTYAVPQAWNREGLDADNVWTGDPEPQEVARRRFLLQAGLADGLVGELRRRMERSGLWDRSLVVVLSDHGSSFTTGTHRRSLVGASFGEIASVPLFVKYPRQRRARVDRAPAQIPDVLATIADVTGRRPAWALDGRSLRRPREARPVSVYAAVPERRVTRSWRSFLRMRAAAVASWNELFRGRTPRAQWAGRIRTLRLQRLSAARRARASQGSAVLDFPAAWQAVRRSSGYLPAVVGAELRGVPAGRRIVAALNGRIVSAGRSYAQNGAVRVTLFLPPARLREGRNRLELLLTRAGRVSVLVRSP